MDFDLMLSIERKGLNYEHGNEALELFRQWEEESRKISPEYDKHREMYIAHFGIMFAFEAGIIYGRTRQTPPGLIHPAFLSTNRRFLSTVIQFMFTEIHLRPWKASRIAAGKV